MIKFSCDFFFLLKIKYVFQDLVVHFKEFKECPGLKNNTIRYNRLELNYVGNDTFIMEGELEALDKVDGDLMVKPKTYKNEGII